MRQLIIVDFLPLPASLSSSRCVNPGCGSVDLHAAIQYGDEGCHPGLGFPQYCRGLQECLPGSAEAFPNVLDKIGGLDSAG